MGPFCACGHEHLVNARDKTPGPCPVCGDACPKFKARGNPRTKSAALMLPSEARKRKVQIPKELTIATAIRDVKDALARLESLVLPGSGKLQAPVARSVIRTSRWHPNHVSPAEMNQLMMNGPSQSNGTTKMGSGHKKTLAAIVQHKDGGLTKKHLTVLTGFKKSTRDTYLRHLSADGYIARDGDTWKPTPSGIDKIGKFEILPTGPDLLMHYLETLPEGDANVLQIVAKKHPGSVSCEEISHETGYTKSTRATYLRHLKARELVRKIAPGRVCVNEELFA